MLPVVGKHRWNRHINPTNTVVQATADAYQGIMKAAPASASAGNTMDIYQYFNSYQMQNNGQSEGIYTGANSNDRAYTIGWGGSAAYPIPLDIAMGNNNNCAIQAVQHPSHPLIWVYTIATISLRMRMPKSITPLMYQAHHLHHRLLPDIGIGTYNPASPPFALFGQEQGKHPPQASSPQ